MITLRDVTEADAKLLCSWENDTFFKGMASDLDHFTTLREQRHDIRWAIRDKSQIYKIIVLHGNHTIGYVRTYLDTTKRYAWLSYGLGEKRGCGFSRQALALCFKELIACGCMRVDAEVYSYNIASQKVLERLGFKKEGVRRKARYIGGTFIDVFVYGLLLSEATFC